MACHLIYPMSIPTLSIFIFNLLICVAGLRNNTHSMLLDEFGNIVAALEIKTGNSWYGGAQKAKDLVLEASQGIKTTVIRILD